MLSITDLSYSYARAPVLHGIDLAVAAGEIVGLIGPNGAGKSTLLKCINRILRPNSGHIIIAGKPIENYGRRELARAVAYVPQQQGSAMSLRVVEMVALGRTPHQGLSTPKHDRDVVWTSIERLGLIDLSFRFFAELSGGQRQRVLIARALTQDARLMLLDEPTSNLDPFYQLETLEGLKSIAAAHRITALVALHDMSLAARFSDRLILLHQGGVHAQGRWENVLTAANLTTTYGIGAVIGTDRGIPYVLPIAASASSCEPEGTLDV